jgi:hypothetical protein
MKPELSRQSFGRTLKYQIYENLSSGCRVVPCGGTDRWAGMTNLIVAFRNFANVPTFIYVQPKDYIYVFCMDPTTNNDYFLIQH